MTKSIFSIVTIFFSLSLALLYVKPLYDRVQSHRAGITTLDQIIASAGTIESLISETEKNLDLVNPADRARFAVFLPEKIDDIRLANTIQHLGTAHSLVLEGIKVELPLDQTTTPTTARQGVAGAIRNTIALDRAPQELGGQAGAVTNGGAKKEERYKTTKANFSFNATYTSFQSFLSDLEKSLELMDITSLSFAPAPSASTDGQKVVGPQLYRFIVEVETYSLQ